MVRIHSGLPSQIRIKRSRYCALRTRFRLQTLPGFIGPTTFFPQISSHLTIPFRGSEVVMVARLLLLCIASALPLPLVAQSSPAAPMANRADEIANSDKSFLQALIEEDISEINLANIALQKTSDPQVK